MYKGKIVKSTNFHTNPYWVISCYDKGLKGNICNELPIDEYSFGIYASELLHGINYISNIEGNEVEFKIIKLGDMYYAEIDNRLDFFSWTSRKRLRYIGSEQKYKDRNNKLHDSDVIKKRYDEYYND